MTLSERAYSQYLNARKQAGLQRNLTDIERPNAREIIIDGKTYLNVCSNDYLALSHNDLVKDRAKEWVNQFGAGTAASRLVTGNLNQFSKLEAKLANQKGKEAALILASGFQANVSILEALFDPKILGAAPLVFADKLNHASMHLGCKTAGIRQIRYLHKDVDHLQQLLERERHTKGPRFILTETIFSMDGDQAPINEIAQLAKEHDALLIVDDAHGAGLFGPDGTGLGHEADITIGTFSKAYGSFGAYVACSKAIKDFLVNRCAGLIYSTALPPAILGSIEAALDLVPKMDEERRHVLNLAKLFRERATALGYNCGSTTSQIVPLIIGTNDAAKTLSEALQAEGIWVTTIRPPTVPANTARLRFAFSAAHTTTDIEKILQALANHNSLQTQEEEAQA